MRNVYARRLSFSSSGAGVVYAAILKIMAGYVEQRGEDYMLSGSRVSLASVVMAWREGLSPESIQDDFPTLRLEQIYGAIAYYLGHQVEIDNYLSALGTDFERRRSEQEALQPRLTAKLLSALDTAPR